MCGIAGKLTWDPRGAIDRDLLGAMTDAVAPPRPRRRRLLPRRGRRPRPPAPEHHRPRHRRSAARQRRRHGLDDLQRRDLQLRRGAPASSRRTATASAPRSDTEVHRPRLRAVGRATCVDRFRGMFAFAVWDAPRAPAAARARSRRASSRSTTPLLDDGLVFGSEIKSLLVDPAVPRDWSPEALDAYLTLLYVPAPLTIYRGVHKLPPGHVLVAERGAGARVAATGTCRSPATATRRAKTSSSSSSKRCSREAVALRLISDVPLGAFLSGGIDSSLVVAFMKETSDAPRHHDVGRVRRAGVRRAASTRATRRPAPRRASSTRTIVTPQVDDAAAEAGLALRRAVRRFVGGADLLRVGGGARARHGGALGRRRRRAVGRATRGTASSRSEQRVRGALGPAVGAWSARLGARAAARA